MDEDCSHRSAHSQHHAALPAPESFPQRRSRLPHHEDQAPAENQDTGHPELDPHLEIFVMRRLRDSPIPCDLTFHREHVTRNHVLV